MAERSWDLGEGVTMHIGVTVEPCALTPRNVARLRRYVDALEVEAAICWEEEGPALPPGETKAGGS